MLFLEEILTDSRFFHFSKEIDNRVMGYRVTFVLFLYQFHANADRSDQ